MKNTLSTTEREALFKKLNLNEGQEHTILFFDLRQGTTTPMVRIKRTANYNLEVVYNPSNIENKLIIKKLKKSL